MASRVAYALAAFALLPAPASAQGRVCAPTAQIVDRLVQNFGEHLAVSGLDANGNMLAIYANPDSGSWTATVTTADRISCVVASGEALAIERPDAPVAEGRPS